MSEYKPVYQNKIFCKEAKECYYSLVGAGCCSGREDDANIEVIRQTIAGAVSKRVSNIRRPQSRKKK